MTANEPANLISELTLCVFQHADILSPSHSQIPQIHQQPAEDAAPDCEFLMTELLE